MNTTNIYQAKHPIRIVTATSLYDGHDVAINIMRRILQSSGAEVIHLGHNRSVQEIVHCAIQEDAQAVAVTSYQGGHQEFFKYMRDLFKENDADHIKIFGGGGGVILPNEINELHAYGIDGIYSPDDGRKLGFQGMINQILEISDFPTGNNLQINLANLKPRNAAFIAKLISAIENYPESITSHMKEIISLAQKNPAPIIGITGTGGAGKSSLMDELVFRFLMDHQDKNLAIISVDPTHRKHGGALLGDKIRMNAINHPNIYMRSLATRQHHLALPKSIKDIINVIKAAAFDLILLETSGIGQADTEIIDYVDLSLYVMTPEYGAATQLEKIDMLDYADLVALNKFDKRGAQDALRDVKKQLQRCRQSWDIDPKDMPVYGTIASRFNDPGVKQLYYNYMRMMREKFAFAIQDDTAEQDFISVIKKNTEENQSPKSSKNQEQNLSKSYKVFPPNRIRYLAEISDSIRNYNDDLNRQAKLAGQLFNIKETIALMENNPDNTNKDLIKQLKSSYQEIEAKLTDQNKKILAGWPQKLQSYKNDDYVYTVKNKEFRIRTYTESLSNLRIPKITLPKYKSWEDILKWTLKENVPGEFPYAAGVFPFKLETEEPTRMFAGEGSPERTNRRFHYVSKGQKAKRLSTAFDSVTLYGSDPDLRPDIYGKIGNSGVSVACLDDAKKLYSGFDLADPMTSVSMTINGPAPIMLGFFFNTVIDQQCEKYIKSKGLEKEVRVKIDAIIKQQGLAVPQYQGEMPESNNGLGLMLLGVTGDQILPKEVYEKIKAEAISKVRGTVQADVLKEDQAQNTCIFSMDFALRMMGDIQQYFIEHEVKNFYSISISGYHIAEAGANPITQLAFTLANGFTYIEYFLSRGFDIDDFAGNLSFFFSNGLGPEYSVIGRVARIIWAKALKHKYKASSRSQKLKYHIQTSGRSLHAQEIEFNDIRTTLQALYAVYDNCNSLHTNAYDEAITTPTEESVRRALAIQMIINHELGLSKNQNPLQGAFIIEELTDLVEQEVLAEFDRLSERGGVLGAMETMYQRGKIQDESLYYEKRKQSGELPVVGVNTFLSSTGSPTTIPDEVSRSTDDEKAQQINMLKDLHKRNEYQSAKLIHDLKQLVIRNENVFAAIMEVSKYCSIGEITNALYDVGGQYRRNI